MSSHDFNIFWSSVWLKVGKGTARKAFKVARRKASLEEILEGSANFARWLLAEKKERQFWPHPATWLNAERWEDELIVSKPPDAEPTPVWGASGFDPEASMREKELDNLLADDAIRWLEQQDDCAVEAAFTRIKIGKGMTSMSIFDDANWRQFPVWTAKAMGWNWDGIGME